HRGRGVPCPAPAPALLPGRGAVPAPLSLARAGPLVRHVPAAGPRPAGGAAERPGRRSARRGRAGRARRRPRARHRGRRAPVGRGRSRPPGQHRVHGRRAGQASGRAAGKPPPRQHHGGVPGRPRRAHGRKVALAEVHALGRIYPRAPGLRGAGAHPRGGAVAADGGLHEPVSHPGRAGRAAAAGAAAHRGAQHPYAPGHPLGPVGPAGPDHLPAGEPRRPQRTLALHPVRGRQRRAVRPFHRFQRMAQPGGRPRAERGKGVAPRLDARRPM
ncbi:MAG: Sulfatase, partial [uncultured Gemmatimonadetes bacterium]